MRILGFVSHRPSVRGTLIWMLRNEDAHQGSPGSSSIQTETSMNLDMLSSSFLPASPLPSVSPIQQSWSLHRYTELGALRSTGHVRRWRPQTKDAASSLSEIICVHLFLSSSAMHCAHRKLIVLLATWEDGCWRPKSASCFCPPGTGRDLGKEAWKFSFCGMVDATD